MKPEFLNNMRRLLKEDYDRFYEALMKEPQKALRVNTLKASAEEVEFKTAAVPWCGSGYYHNKEKIGNTWQNRLGLIYSQDASAMAPVEILEPKPGDKVLDLCAAPGGKSTQIAQHLNGTGLLVSNEIVPARAKILYENIERLGVANALVLNEDPRRLEKKFFEYFDKILVDAPCSGEGMFRKDSNAAREWTPQTNEICAERQKLILNSAAKMLKCGGTLVYSTCTFSPVENEEVISAFLKEHGDYEVSNIDNELLSDGIEPLAAAKRIYPHIQRGEGHFIAKLVKTEGGAGECAETEEAGKINVFDDFKKDFLTDVDFYTYLNGNRVYLCPEKLPETAGLRSLGGGIYAGDILKGRFKPNHFLASALKNNNFKYVVKADDGMYAKYIHGETIAADAAGWCAVVYKNHAVGWGKGSAGVIKNHYPKGLRSLC